MQVSYVSGWTCTFTTCMLKKKISPDVHFQSQFNAPLEFPMGSKISGCQPDIHFHAPIYVAKATESIPTVIISHRLQYIRGLSLVDYFPV